MDPAAVLPAGPQSSPSEAGDQERASKRMHSRTSTQYSFVRFRNGSVRRVQVIWIDYKGDSVAYYVMPPGGSFDMNTFVTHPWVFQDADTGDRMVAMGKETFEPVAYDPRDGWPPRRTEVTVHLPVYSLEERCLQIVRDSIPPEEVEKASVPALLRQRIQQAITDKHNRFRPRAAV